MAKETSVFALKAKNIKIIFCCYHVQISLTMSQQTQTDIFHTKMLRNALWCQITWSKCMLCNILEYCSQTLDIVLQGFQSGPVPGTFTRLRSCIVPAEITEPPKISGGQNHKYDGR